MELIMNFWILKDHVEQSEWVIKYQALLNHYNNRFNLNSKYKTYKGLFKVYPTSNHAPFKVL